MIKFWLKRTSRVSVNISACSQCTLVRKSGFYWVRTRSYLLASLFSIVDLTCAKLTWENNGLFVIAAVNMSKLFNWRYLVFNNSTVQCASITLSI